VNKPISIPNEPVREVIVAQKIPDNHMSESNMRDKIRQTIMVQFNL